MILRFFLICSLVLIGCGSDSSTGSDYVEQKIVNGTEIDPAVFPQFVMVLSVNSEGQVGGCSGTVIGSQAVITAAHCVTENTQIYVKIPGDGGPTLSVPYAEVAEGYNPGSPDFTGHDVAVLFTDQPIGLPALPLLASKTLPAGTAASIFGFGLEDGQNGSYGTLRMGSITIDALDQYRYLGTYTGTNSDSCFGDSGGPLVYSDATGPAIAGITSAGSSPVCGVGDTTAYTNVSSYAAGIAKLVPDIQLK